MTLLYTQNLEQLTDVVSPLALLNLKFTVTDSLAPIYASLSQEIASSAQQDLQRVIPLFWNMQFGDAPTFYRFHTVTFLDIRSCTQEERWQLQSILIDMNIPYYIQKRLLFMNYGHIPQTSTPKSLQKSCYPGCKGPSYDFGGCRRWVKMPPKPLSFPKHGSCPALQLFLVNETGQVLWAIQEIFNHLFRGTPRTFQQVHAKMQKSLPRLWGQIFPEADLPTNFFASWHACLSEHIRCQRFVSWQRALALSQLQQGLFQAREEPKTWAILPRMGGQRGLRQLR